MGGTQEDRMRKDIGRRTGWGWVGLNKKQEEMDGIKHSVVKQKEMDGMRQ